jgi:hypothetical protein
VIQNKRSIFWNVIAWATVRKGSSYEHVVIEIELFESPDEPPSDFCLLVWMKSEVYQRKVDTPDEFLARILDTSIQGHPISIYKGIMKGTV